MLSNVDIEKAIDRNEIRITPDETELCIEPSSIDLHLSDMFLRPEKKRDSEVDVADEDTYPEYETHRDCETITVAPDTFLLADTDEYVELSDKYVGVLHDRSSLARLGLLVQTAGFVDATFEGTLTLEIYNAAPYPITIYPGMRVVQLAIHEHDTHTTENYTWSHGNKYQGQICPRPSELYKDAEL